MIASIRSALDAKMATLWQGDFAWEFVVYAPVLGKPYVSVRLSGYDANPLGIGPDTPTWHNGVYQASVVWPMTDGASGALVARTIRDGFKRGTTLTVEGHSLIVMRSAIRPPLNEGDWSRTPVIIEWNVEEFP